MTFVNGAWTTGDFGSNKRLKVRVSIGDLPEVALDPIVEYEIFDSLQAVKLDAGKFPL